MNKKYTFWKTLFLAGVMATVTACTLDGEDGAVGPTGPQGADGTDGADGGEGPAGTPGVSGKDLPRELSIEVVGRFATGIYGKSAAEIVQFHATSQSIFAVNAANNQIDVINLSSLPTVAVANPLNDESLSSSAFTFPDTVDVTDNNSSTTINLGDANSIAIFGDMLAIAVAADLKQDNGAVLFYSLDMQGQGSFVKGVEVGSLPDMVTFSPDGSKLLVANEGEPTSDYTNDPEGSISVISLNNGVPDDTASHINFTSDMTFSSDLVDPEDFDTDEKRMQLLANDGVKFAGPAGNTVAKDLEPEYITVSADGSKAYVALQENNAIAIVDLDDMNVEVRALGFKNWADYDIDFTNEDELPSFSRLPNVFGMYQPDSIASYSWNGASFILSANEGDSRDYDAYSEEIRVEDIIDPDELNQTLSPALQDLYDATGGDDGLGRLKITTALGDADNNGEYEALYAYGARSFSIWDQNINLVFDSGDDFGKISSAILGENFNSAHTENKGDNRSDDKGGEPEAIAVGDIEGRTYAFIASERSGDLFIYDVTNPFQVAFVAHYNNRDFDVEFELDDDLDNPCDTNEGLDCTEVPNAGDLGPESITFIDSASSPNGNALIVIGNEVSGTVTVYQITEL
ncbi:choice-of-anchor I family protein [Aestuariibacter sp. P117]|uniref:Choice-of-anchor I family protein n=2 Tax=Glaciecola petra TaxID=3075602 RepID=A0ABU2ZTA7_9ALTE|nr:choice-of-anchor I family protein [Aestuariibacter sp. P117]MDT0595862.1 choice-of-anchor I family protein [Aestuariibacter sp. P117]